MSEQENDNLVESNNTVTTISHHTMLDLLRATLLVYNYGKNFKVQNKDETIEEFVSELKEEHELEKLEMNSVKKNILVEMSENVPSGKLH